MLAALDFISRRFKVFACLAYAISSLEAFYEIWKTAGAVHAPWSGALTQYFINYVDHGFARRALVGSLLRPLTSSVADPELVIFGLMVLINLTLFVLVLYGVERFFPHRSKGSEGAVMTSILRCSMAIGSAGCVQIIHDMGRLDHLAYGVLVLACMQVVGQRFILAGLLAACAVLLHEAFAIYGLPLLLALTWQTTSAVQSNTMRFGGVVSVGGFPTIAAVAVLLHGNSDLAAASGIGTGGAVWARGLVEIALFDMSAVQLIILAAYWLALGALFFALYRGNRKRPDLMLIAAFCPLALNVFGTDHARWVTLTFFVGLLNIAVQTRFLGMRLSDPGPWGRVMCLMLCLPLGPLGLIAPLAWLEPLLR